MQVSNNDLGPLEMFKQVFLGGRGVQTSPNGLENGPWREESMAQKLVKNTLPTSKGSHWKCLNKWVSHVLPLF